MSSVLLLRVALAATLAATSSVHAFVPLTGRTAVSSLFESKDESADAVVKSTMNKQIAYDDKTSRFFETTIDEEDCIPDDEFCVTDKETGELVRLTMVEKERIFVDALQAYYSSGRQLLSDAEFDLLKEDLSWNGSAVVVMNRKEAKYLAAMQEYLKGTPTMPDAEFDALKAELLEDGSRFAVQTEPKCYIDTGVCKVTMTEDKFRSNLLYLPATIALTTVWLGFAYELIEPLIRLNPLFLVLLGSPLIYKGAIKITEEYLFQDFQIARGPCPNCGAENVVYFGNILGVEGFSDLATFKCTNCKEQVNVQRRNFRASTLPKA